MSSHYQQAITLLEEVFQGKRDAMSCLFTLARTEPEAFCRALMGQNQWAQEVMEMVRHDNRIAAIKKLREERGLGLKEAKDITDHARELMGLGKMDDALRVIRCGAVQEVI